MFSLVGVSADFGTWRGMLIGYGLKFTPTVIKFTPIGACSLVGMSAEFGTLGGMLIGYSH